MKINRNGRFFLGVSFVVLTFLLMGPVAWAGGQVPTPGWDGGSGHNWPGWTWKADASGFGDQGWTSNSGVTVSGDIYPRSFEKTDLGSHQDANLVSTNIPPYKASGTVLKVTTLSGIHDPGWWVDYPYPNYGQLGITTTATNRMSLWMYHEGGDDMINTSTGVIDALLDVGTYNCSSSCPTEESNAHWYIRLTGHSGTWIHYVLNNNPDHRRGENGQINPGLVTSYFYKFYKWYFAWSVGSSGSTAPYSWYLDNVTYSAASNENEYIGATWVGFWPAKGYWEIGLSDMYAGTRDASTVGTFEVRWSTSPITNANYSSATLINPQFFSYSTNRIRNPNPWMPYLWTRFSLPAGTEANNSKIYFAMKDVSATANGDGHNAPTGNIRTIDYQLRPTGSPPPARIPFPPGITGVH